MARVLPKSWPAAAAVGVAALALSLAACSDAGNILDNPEDDDGALGISNLTISQSRPESGDATLTEAAVLTIDAEGKGFDELALSQTVGDTKHDVVVTWNTLTHAIRGTSHVWGPGETHGGEDSGFTACFAGINDCDGERVVIDFDGHSVTFSGQVLDDAFGGDATSTLSGTVGW